MQTSEFFKTSLSPVLELFCLTLVKCALWCAAQSPHGCCRGWHLEGEAQKVAKTIVKLSTSNSVKPTPDSLFGNVDFRRAVKLAKDTEMWKSLRL